jgi:hypothetical protein
VGKGEPAAEETEETDPHDRIRGSIRARIARNQFPRFAQFAVTLRPAARRSSRRAIDKDDGT